jgi:hypothetical protein
MDPVAVTARFDPQGKAYPKQFVWGGRVYDVTSTGRRWRDQAGEHILVMTAEAKTYELIFDPHGMHWLIKPTDASPKIALSS